MHVEDQDDEAPLTVEEKLMLVMVYLNSVRAVRVVGQDQSGRG
ncbi:hypothetical protein P5W04_10390 [Mycobacteroides abscessus subsp. abscessus]|nr:hypothetical protein [Mycobacteroides abscessus]MDO3240523.1 hypothetical protein [Mycobacteroides abscessus subsp. abscessus]